MTVHSDGHDATTAVDLALPSKVHLGQLLPSIVDLVHAEVDAVAAGGRWTLHRTGGAALDESLTLQDNLVYDGDLLWLSANGPPRTRWAERDASHVVARAAPTDGPALRYLSVFGGVAAAAVAAAALVWSARVTAGTEQLVLGAGLSIAAIAGSIVARRAYRGPLLCVSCSVIAVVFAAVTGALAVPEGPAAAHLLLASAAAFSVSTLLLRSTGCGTTPLTALATVTLLAVIVSLAGVTWHLHAAAAGASLATLSVAALSVAPRVAIAIARIGPTAPDGDDPATSPIDIDETRGHATLTGLVTGSSVAAAIGAVLVVYGEATSHRSPLASVAFTTVVGVVLMLRARTHVVPIRQIVLLAGGLLCAAAAFGIAAMSAPDVAHWLTLLAVTAGAGALVPLLGLTVGPAAHRTAEITEYLALAAVVPLACWIGGVYGLVRGLALL